MSNARHTFNNVLRAHEDDLLVKNNQTARKSEKFEVKKSNLKSRKCCGVAQTTSKVSISSL